MRAESNHHDDHESDHSYDLYARLRDTSLSDEERLQLFEQLLALHSGFWGGCSLRAWVLRATYHAKRVAVSKGARADAIDDEGIAHDVLLLFFEQTKTIENPRAWLGSLARRRIRFEVCRQPGLMFGKEIDAGKIAIAEQSTRSSSSSEKDLGVVRDAIAALPSPRRELMIAFYAERQKTNDIAVEFGLSPACVRQHLSRGRKQIEKAIREFQKAVTT